MANKTIHEANGISLDDYFYSGRSISVFWDYGTILKANKIYSDLKVDVRIGPVFGDISGKGEANHTYLLKNGNQFVPGIYVPESKLKGITSAPQNKVSLKEGISRLEKSVGSSIRSNQKTNSPTD